MRTAIALACGTWLLLHVDHFSTLIAITLALCIAIAQDIKDLMK